MNHSAMKYLGIDNLDNTKTALLMIDIQYANLEDMRRAGAEIV